MLKIKFYKKHFIRLQILFTIAGSFVCLLWGEGHMISFFVGASLMVTANTIFLLRLFFRKPKYHPVKEVIILYACEFIKLILVAVGTILVAIYVKPKFLPYITGVIILQLTMWLMPFFVNVRKT